MPTDSTAQAAPGATPDVIDDIRVIGNRRIPKETVLARLYSHRGDTYDPITVERDFNSLWNTGYFANVRIEREDTPKGVILNVYVTGEADHSRDQSQRLEFRLLVRRAGPLQEGKGRTDGREPIRSDQGRARRRGAARVARRAWPPVRRREGRRQENSAGLGLDQPQYQGRTDGQGGQDRVHRQRATIPRAIFAAR